MKTRPKLTWLLAPISLGAFVATWGGWARLAPMTGYTDVEMFPGVDWSRFNIGIVLPVTVEPFGALAMAVAFNSKVKPWARAIAGVMAVSTLVAAGICQAVVHHLTVAGQTVAPDLVVSVTSVLPVVVLGLGGALAMLSQVRKEFVSEPSRETSRWAGIAGRLAEAAASRAERALAGTSQEKRDETWDDFEGETRDDPAPTSPGIPGTEIPAGQKPGTGLIVPPAKALDKDPKTLRSVLGWLAEKPKPPTVEQIAERLGTSRSTAGRVALAARKSTNVPAEPGQ